MQDTRQATLTLDAIKAAISKARADGCLVSPIRLAGTPYYIWHPSLGWLDHDKVKLQ